jgi:glycosyltransferase involved in cell wall biosynthesis
MDIKHSRMKIFVTGTRGIPDIPGGIEKHCQELYPRIAAKGHTILVSRRKPYTTNSAGLADYNGVKLIDYPTAKHPSLEAIIHTFISILAARLISPDIVHVHAVGPSLLVPFARILGLRVIFTNHGPDYERDKWGQFAKCALKLGEYLGGRYANKTIVISSPIADIVCKRCSIDPVLIPNGVVLPSKTPSIQLLKSIGITSKGYILAVSRLVPEKGLHDLIRAFSSLKTNINLVIAGDADHESNYSRMLKNMARNDSRVILTGYITGELLSSLYAHARLFVLPSYHEGHPIALLEALSYGLPVLVSDIRANLEIGLSNDNYFQCGNIQSLFKGLVHHIAKPLDEGYKERIRAMIQEKYNWDSIADRTIDVYQKIITSHRNNPK